MNYNVVSLFHGMGSWTEPMGDNVNIWSNDNNIDFKDHTTHIGDFMDIEADTIREYFNGERIDFLAASIPCQCFSVASIGVHWGGGAFGYRPKTQAAFESIALVRHTMKIIAALDPRYFVIENPRGMLRKLGPLNHLERVTVWYCQYGPTAGVLRAKPTDLWGVFPPSWKPRPPCKNHTFENGVKTSTHCNHEAARRGMDSGNNRIRGAVLRSLVPQELCQELWAAVISKNDRLYPNARGVLI